MTDNIDDRDSPEKFNPVDGLPKPESSLMVRLYKRYIYNIYVYALCIYTFRCCDATRIIASRSMIEPSAEDKINYSFDAIDVYGA